MIANVKVQRFNSARGYIFFINVSGGIMDRILNMFSSYTGKSWVSAVAKAMIANVKVARLYSTQGYSFILIVSEGTMIKLWTYSFSFTGKSWISAVPVFFLLSPEKWAELVKLSQF